MTNIIQSVPAFVDAGLQRLGAFVTHGGVYAVADYRPDMETLSGKQVEGYEVSWDLLSLPDCFDELGDYTPEERQRAQDMKDAYDARAALAKLFRVLKAQGVEKVYCFPISRRLKVLYQRAGFFRVESGDDYFLVGEVQAVLAKLARKGDAS